jgi:hypothetical protein
MCQQKRVAMLLVRPRNIQHPLCLMIVRLSTTLLSSSPIYSALSIVYKNHTLKYSIGYARTSPYCNDHIPISSSVSPVFVLPKYTFPPVNLNFKCHHGLGQAEVANFCHANHVLELYTQYAVLGKVYVVCVVTFSEFLLVSIYFW